MCKIASRFCLLVAVSMLLGLAGCGKAAKEPSPPVVPTAQSKPSPDAKPQVDRTDWPVIVTFGDSLTFGQGVERERNYPSQLQAELDKLGYQYHVVNAGVSGDTTTGGVARLDLVLKQKPQIVILELGANDGLRGQPVAQMRQNLVKMIEALQKEKVTVVLAGMEVPPNYGPEYTVSFRKTFTDLAQQYQLPLIPFFLEGVGGDPNFNLPDGIHPTAEGYRKVVQNLLPVLEPLLKR
jgi:acyl-CoA thioesterase-1